jgi:hypothetical protein
MACQKLFIVAAMMEIDVFTPASTTSVRAFMAIVIAVLVAFVIGVRAAYRRDGMRGRQITRRAAVGAAVWVALTWMAVGTGALAAMPLGGFPVFFGAVLVVGLATGLSSVGARLGTLPMWALVGFQAFRLPLELVLHSWATQGTIPYTMTWSGQNWDVVSGVVALVAAPWADRSRAVAWIANGVGAVLLLNVMRVAALSAPVPFGWHVTPPLVVAWHLPYALIGPVCVCGAIVGHVVLTRALVSATRR